MTQDTTNTVTDGPYFYAKSKGLNLRESARFTKMFQDPNAFRVAVNDPSNAIAIQGLIKAAGDFGLDRTGLTRSQIVTAYNKQDKLIKLIGQRIGFDCTSALQLINESLKGVDLNQLDTIQTRAYIISGLISIR